MAEVSFQVTLATRDRPVLFERALKSVLAQDYGSTHVQVLVDGSTPENLAAYHALETKYQDVTFIYLLPRENGHGQSYVFNEGVSRSICDYICFLDDDDEWTDPEYLSRVATSLAKASTPVDMHITNQKAYLNDDQLKGPIWLENLTDVLQKRHILATAGIPITLADIVSAGGFCHLNTLIVRRQHWLDCGGMEEGIRWECDRDVFFRLADKANGIHYDPAYVSAHYVPDPKAKSSMTTSLAMHHKRLYQLRVFDRLMALCDDAGIRRYATRQKGYTLKKMAVELQEAGDNALALHYAKQALAVMPGLKWAAYRLYLSLKAFGGSSGFG